MSGSQFGGNNSSSSSSRRGKKSASDKPKQPQRGLGVAQLEKIRLHSQLEEMKMQAYAAMQPSIPQQSHFAYGYPHPMMMGFADMEGSNPRFDESQSYNQPRWNPSHVSPDNQHRTATKHFLDTIEDPVQSTRMNYWPMMNESSSQNPSSSDSQDLDLELRL